jgi:hypothetical protein
MQLLPYPENLKLEEGYFELSEQIKVNLRPECGFETLELCDLLLDLLGELAGSRIVFTRSSKEIENSITLKIGSGKPQGYTLEVGKTGICICGNDTSGLFYGIQTLCQILISEGRRINFCTIEDSPDFAVRGLYHDCTRGKVPTLETLFALVDKMAFYKLNELQLYVEHTFAFAKHCDLWAGADPLTAEEIIKLDAYCRKNFIDLVPSLSTFGHMYMMLRCKRKEHLNELDIKASEKLFSFHDRMAHYTLDCSQQESAELVKEIIDEYAPLFSSKYFNICCDETFDLGKGKNAAKAEKVGASRLYVDFLKPIFQAVKDHGKIPQFWGDIILKEPEMLKEMPEDVIALNWDYSVDLWHSDSKSFADAGMKFYNCPGTCCWNTTINNFDTSTKNIINFARQGKEFGASGLLNTNWGDYGHINSLAMSYHGIILGAAVGWNIDNNSDTEKFDNSFNLLEFGSDSSEVAQLLRKADSIQKVRWFSICRWCDPSITPEGTSIFSAMQELTKDFDTEGLKEAVDSLEATYSEMLDALAGALSSDPLASRELLCGIKGSILMHKIAVCVRAKTENIQPDGKYAPCVVADGVVKYENELSELWHLRNKPSEYYRIKNVLLEIVSRLNSL